MKKKCVVIVGEIYSQKLTDSVWTFTDTKRAFTDFSQSYYWDRRTFEQQNNQKLKIIGHVSGLVSTRFF